jgi:hypothetical protein
MVTVSWLVRWRRVHALRRSAHTVSVPAGMEISVPAMSNPDLIEPGVFGILQPVLLLPEGIAERLNPTQLDAILAHEFCHIRRPDNLTATNHMAVQAIFWFHPLTWWIGARLVHERERAYDEEVLRLGCKPNVYAESVLMICKLYLSSPLARVSGVTGSDDQADFPRQRFLDLLNRTSPVLHETVSQPPDGAHRSNLFRWTEGIPQQPVGVQLPQPWALLHVVLAPRQILGPPRIDRKNLDPILFQYFLQCDPIHAGGLHGHRLDAAGFQPFAQPVQIGPSTIRTLASGRGRGLPARPQNDSHCLHRFLPHPGAQPPVPDRPHSTSAATPCVPGDSTCRLANAQKWTSSSSPWHTLFALGLARLGSVGVHYTNSPTGSSLAFSGLLATKK